MFADEDLPKKPKGHEIGMDLSSLSIDELMARIGVLKEEIVRLEAEVVAKGSTRAAADAFFRKD